MSTQILKDRFELKKTLVCTDFRTVYLACDRHHPQRPPCQVMAIQYRQREIRHRLEREAQILEQLSQSAAVPELIAYFYTEAEHTPATKTGSAKTRSAKTEFAATKFAETSQPYEQNLDRQNTFYFVQTHISGHPLSVEIKPGKRLSESYVVKLIQDVLVSLNSIHAQGVVHQQLHPQHLIRQDKDGQIFLTYFADLSRLERSEVDASGNLFTVVPMSPHAYVAPEQLQPDYDQNPQPASDLYALGLIAIEALTGRSHHDFSYDPVRGLMWREGVEVSLHLAEFIDRLVRQDWRDRFDSAKQAMDTLSQGCDRQRIAQNSRLPTVIAAPGAQPYKTAIQPGRSSANWPSLPPNRSGGGSGGAVAKAAASPPASPTRFSRPQPLNPRLFKIFVTGVAVLLMLGLSVRAYQWGRYRLSRLPQDWQSWTANVLPASDSNAPDNAATNVATNAAKPSQLTNLLEDGSILLRPEAADAYWRMFAAARAEGIELYALSGYREPAQTAEGASNDDASSASVSDYHTGYAVDIGGSEKSTDRQLSFRRTEAFRWLKANAQTYGFELSSPKRGLIGSSPEPWHWRYNPQADKSKN
ncbi:D-alanyl-D-alanine carboxypeptidase family protein [cf. Phormidesmis sp. LEGE 11477]|uniref:D-alanyl-D-alanine carboxypeptidase family protein n=1 Tax=cf. Phormidesmis sp. LEGE 11477 TaxID=1828680 RepID=UPI001881AD86|nr:D-alanyl-D-alanine carboxypeptidase family protein [cf. Phormidesmis sp. LEGE 11477]MBE9060876.1 D-alanyl-D-alanine carboxypeptidase family protein [cf. Phormidesmis sp. LEGE 11477]